MDLTDFSNGKLWAITEPNLQTMLDRLPDVFSQQKEAASFTVNPKDRDDFKLRDGVAIIPVTGPITKRGSFYSFLYGGTPLDQLTDVYMDAIGQKDVEAIVFDFDSPGGTIAGLEAFGDIVFKHRRVKPMVSFAGGMMTSAAYWIGSASHKIVTAKTADIGNVGILMIHYDYSKEDEKWGVKRTIIKSGKFKAIGNDAEPLTDFAKTTFQAEIDYVHGLFIDTALTRNRKMKVIPDNDITEAKIYIGQQAVDVGLADKVGSLDTAIELALSLVKPKNTFYFSTGASAQKKETLIMGENEKQLTIETVRDLEVAVPNLVKEIETRAVKALDIDKKVSDAVDAEKARIVGIAAEMFGEEGEKFQAIIDQGLTIDQFKAVKGVIGLPEKPAEEETDESKAQAAALKALESASPDNPGSGGAIIQKNTDFMALVDAYQTEKKCTRTDALRAIASQNQDAHKKYLEGLETVGNA